MEYFFGDGPNSLDAADDDEADQNRHHDAEIHALVAVEDHPKATFQCGLGDAPCLIGLKHIAATKRTTDAEEREYYTKGLGDECRQASFFESHFEIVHGAAMDGAVIVNLPVNLRECTFVELRRHAEET